MLFLFVLCNILIGIAVTKFSNFVTIISDNYNRNTQFESGINTQGDARLPIAIKFYLFVILFMIFDVEIPYFLIWCVSIKPPGWIGFTEMSFFMMVILTTLLYLKKNQVLNLKITSITKKK